MTAASEVTKAARRLAGPSGDMDKGSRLAVMRALLSNIQHAARYGDADRPALIRLAAHCVTWADELDAKNADDQ